MSIAIEAVSWWETKGHGCDFPMYAYFISSNAFDLPLNGWRPECVVHDTDPFQLLSRISLLPDGQSKWAWASEMLCLYSLHELSEITFPHTEHLMQTRRAHCSIYLLANVSIWLFHGKHLCARHTLCQLEWMRYFTYSVFYLPVWLIVMICVHIAQYSACQWMNVTWDINENCTSERSRKKIRNQRHFKWFNMNNEKWYMINVRYKIWTIYIEILSP